MIPVEDSAFTRLKLTNYSESHWVNYGCTVIGILSVAANVAPTPVIFLLLGENPFIIVSLKNVWVALVSKTSRITVKKSPQTVATEIVAVKYPDARIVFLAGSVMRGEGTETSDLDLVVILEHVPQAYRESFNFGEWPVEAFVHDPETLRYFFQEVDRLSGVPSLPAMVLEGLVLPQPNALSAELKHLAKSVVNAGPPAWHQTELQNSRYAITDLVEDMRAPRSRNELMACATLLYPLLANHHLRSKGLWSARGKSIPRRLSEISADFEIAFSEAFRSVFEQGNTEKLVQLCEEVLTPHGGWLFDGYTILAPASWRKAGGLATECSHSESPT